MAMIPVITT